MNWRQMLEAVSWKIPRRTLKTHTLSSAFFTSFPSDQHVDSVLVGEICPGRSGGRIFFSNVNFLCWLLLPYPFHPRVTAVARKISRSFCHKCRWHLVTAKHVLYVALQEVPWHDAWLYGVHWTRRDGSSFTWHQPCSNQKQRCDIM